MKIFIFVFGLLLALNLAGTNLVMAQEARVNQKKIERERNKKHRETEKQYQQAIKRHNKMQSKPTRASMKQTKKESRRSMPIQK